MAAHSMSKQSVAAGLSVCSKPHRWNSAFISARNKTKEKISFFLLALSRLTCDAIGGEGQHLRSTGAGGDGSKKRGRRLPRRRHRHPQERISTSFHCSRILAEIYEGFGTTASWGITPILRGFGLRRWARRWVTGDACVFRNGNQAGSLLWRR
jgi:hypothetical protein